MYSSSEVLEAIMQGIPYPQHVSSIDLSSEPERAVRFTWRRERFRISLSSGNVVQCENGCLCGSDLAILFEHLLKMALIKIFMERPPTRKGMPNGACEFSYRTGVAGWCGR